MKILFICSSLEPEQDGVGDYTRKLACALIKDGHKAIIIALNDRHLQGDAWTGMQKDNNIEIKVLRLPELLSWNLRMPLAKKFATDFNADWISLQFVPFGYQIKGLPFQLHEKLKKLSNKGRWHVMFHELSVNKNESLKFSIWAFFQISIIKTLLKKLLPALITTNTQVYQYILKNTGYTAYVLPLFSNIARTDNNGSINPANQIPAYLLKDRPSYLIGTLFGTFSFKSWNLHSLLNKISNQYASKKIIIASIGKMSSGVLHWETLKYKYPFVTFLESGIQDSAFISYWLSQYTDFGILTTLPELSGKSGSFMAFKEHGIPVLCKEPEEELREYNIELDDCLTVVKEDSTPLKIPAKFKPHSMLENTAKEFIQLLNR